MTTDTDIFPRHSADEAADKSLARLGYQAELPRKLSMVSILGLSFAIMASPYGISTTLYITLTDGQAVSVLWGWVFVSLISLAISSSLAEIFSVYPTAGGIYYVSAVLSPPKWAAVNSWICGYATLAGNYLISLSVNFGGAQLILSAINLWDEDYVPTPWQTVLMLWCVMTITYLVNFFGSKYLDLINQICLYWTASSIVVILITLLAMADTRRSGEYVFGHYDASASGWPQGWAFFVGLLQAAYTLSGYGMVAAMSEEVQNPEREVPKGMVLSVAAAAIAGLLFIIPVLFVLPNVEELLNVPGGQPIGLIFKRATGSAAGGFGLLFLIWGIWFFAGVGCMTACSRCTWAFARDGAIPGSRLWKRVNKRLDIPLWGLTLSFIIQCALGAIYFGSSAALNSFTGAGTLCLAVSYGTPILISVIRGRKMIKNAPFSLGRFGLVINLITIAWFAFAIVIFCLPYKLEGLNASSMNYASVVTSGFVAVSVFWYIVRGRKSFTGPPILEDRNLQVVLGQVSSSSREGAVSGATGESTDRSVHEK